MQHTKEDSIASEIETESEDLYSPNRGLNTLKPVTLLESSSNQAQSLKNYQMDDNRSEAREQEIRKECSSVSHTTGKVTPDLTIVLIGDTDSIEIGSGNLLIDKEDPPVEGSEFSQMASRIYDLCGRHISIIPMLSLDFEEQEKLIENITPGQPIHAFILLIPFGKNENALMTHLEWLQNILGERSLAFSIAVFTYENEQNCSIALEELQDNIHLKNIIEKNGIRLFTCKRSMNDPSEIVALLDKIGIVDSLPCVYTREMYEAWKIKKQLHKVAHEKTHKKNTDPGPVAEFPEYMVDSPEQPKATVETILGLAEATPQLANIVQKPTKATIVISEHTLEPSEATQETSESKSEPTESTGEKPISTGEKPKSTGKKPKSTGKKPKSTSEKPKSTGEKPKSTSETPESTSEPSQATQGLLESNLEPTESTGEKPKSTSETPKSTGDKPKSTSEKPTSTGEKPKSTGEKPTSTSETPESTLEPSQATQGLLESTLEPTESTGEKPKSTGETPKSTEEKPKSTSETPKPTGEKPKSTSEKLKSTGEKPKSTSETPESTGDKPKSTSEKPKPTGEKPKSTSEKPTSTGEKPKSTGEKPTSTSGTPESTSEPSQATQGLLESNLEPTESTGEKPKFTSETPESTSEPSQVTQGLPESEQETPESTSEPSQAMREQPKVDPEQSTKTSGEVEKLLSRLHLQDKCHDKLKTADFLTIGSATRSKPLAEKDLAHAFLERLLMLDYRARYIPVGEDDSDGHNPKDKSKDGKARTEDDDDAYDVLFNITEKTDQKINQTHIHPMDVQMAIFHCSDNFLRQYIVTKLSFCQYALPLLVPDPFNKYIECPLWTFRQITKSWKFTDSSNIITSKSMPISKAETPMVSFFRLGSVSCSKSQLMNNLINERHSTFFHRDRPGSTKTRVLMDGVAEIAWYCPSGKANDAFTDCIAFCNLHGDAVSNERQRKILIDEASVNVVLLPTLGKGDISMTIVSELMKTPKPLICLLSEDNSGAIEIREGKYKIGLKDRSQSDVSEELKRIICKTLSAPFSLFCITNLENVSGIRVDEEDKDCQAGKSAALQVLEPLQGMPLSKIKEAYLPCQGQLWHEWCKINKDLYRLKENLEMEKCQIQQELKQIRFQQRGSAFSDLMQNFFTYLLSMASDEKTYFLKWIGILLDELSTEELSEVHREYDKVWSEVLTLKKKRSKPDQLKKRQAELEGVSESLQSATIGFEHIMREMGQIYEAHASLSNIKTLSNKINISYLPELAADLMISGHPMELMDGDAAHVPLTWINGVLDEVTRKLNDPKIFVLSVLGIQSTGKSTMLNAMFGLQFAVSAGRCTRGAFMQLVKMSDEMKKEFKFDYILVVDTEGLRALELAGKATVHHDNELATFVIGLGNMTLINIFGENPAEMQDVLQIAVQAFMRMKKVKLYPSCVFVHQNVGDITAGEKNMEGKRRLQEKLDEMTLLAAKEEGVSDECFSDVIAFDVQKDVKYFAQLWEGSPPMAPPNPGYSESVQELKNIILSKTNISDGMSLSTFKSTIHVLWNALLNENFVFSFKNTLEIAVYRKLEVQYGKWTWSLRSAMLTIENQFHNRIENEKLNKVDQKDLVADMRKKREDVETAMKKYFDEDRDKDMLVQWRGRFESKIVELHDELVKGVKRKLEGVIQQRQACKKLDDQKIVYEKTLFQKSKELALKLKDNNMNENELNEEFNTVWEGWAEDVTMDIPSIGDINIAEDFNSILGESGYELSFVYRRQSCKRYLDMNKGNYSEYVTLNKQQDPTTSCQETQQHTEMKENNEETPQKVGVWHAVKNFLGMGSTKAKEIAKEKTFENQQIEVLTHKQQRLIDNLIENILKHTKKTVRNKPTATRGYSKSYMQEIVVDIKDKVMQFESKNWIFKKEFVVDLSLLACHFAEQLITDFYKQYRNNNDALTYLAGKRQQYYSVFESFFKGTSSTTLFGKMICPKLKDSMEQAVYAKTAIGLAGELVSSFPPFSGNRSNLEKHILASLAHEEDFDGYLTYIKMPKTYFKQCIKETVKRYILKESHPKAFRIIEENVKSTWQLVSRAVHETTEKIKIKNGNTNMWLEEFSNVLTKELKFDTNTLENFCDISDFDFLEEVINAELSQIYDEIKRSLSMVSLLKMEKFRVKPDEILIKHFCDCCWIQCPFCHAICTNSMEAHTGVDHSVPFHRPYGVNGVHPRGTIELCTAFCTSSVASENKFYPNHDSEEMVPFKEYRNGGPKFADWSITPDGSELPYWKWFVCRFQEQLENHYSKKFQGSGAIPSQWRSITKEQAIASLDEMFL